MVTRRSYFSILILMAVITFLFLLPKIFEEYSIRYHNRKIEDSLVEEKVETTYANAFMLAEGSMAMPGKKLVYILDDNSDADRSFVIEEWCTYRKFQYRKMNSLKECAGEVPDFIVVGRYDCSGDITNIIMTYLEAGSNVIFTEMPDYEAVANDKAYMDMLGIVNCKQESINVEELHIFNDFFVSRERIYSNKDFYGDKNKFKMEIPYYELRAGYQVFAQAKVKDVEYMDYPPVLWRTYTGKGLVFVVNTDLFEGKNLLGILTAFSSQCDSFDVYPVVNAQTVSVINFPVINNENKELFEKTYDRDMYSFSRDILWPGVSTILQNYNKSYNFFMAPKLDYSNDDMTHNPDIEYYYSEIVAKLGSLGVSYDQVSDQSLAHIKSTLDEATQNDMPYFRQRAVYVPDGSLGEEDSVKDGNSNIVFTDLADERPIVEREDDGTIRVCFTSCGVKHNIDEDLRLISVETTLGIDMQSTNIMDVLFENDDTYWEKVSTKWASETTYLNDFNQFDTLSVEESRVRFNDFLLMDYEAKRVDDNSIQINITTGNAPGYFILRLWNEQVTGVSSGEYKKINDTTYLISVADKDTVVSTKRRK